MTVSGFRRFGGKHCETGALKNVLAHLGVTAPHTGQAFTEEMLLGIGGGIGAMYWVFQFGETPFFFVGARYGEPRTLMIEEVAKRLGIPATLRKTGSARRGAADLEALLAAGRPAIAWVDMPMLPYLAVPACAHFGGHVVVVYGIENGEALITDRGAAGLRALVKWADLVADARHAKGWPKVFARPVHLYGALDGMRAINTSLDRILAGAKKRFPVASARVPELLGGLREAILKLHDAEVAAATDLEACLR
jgi:hypothetical protein